MNTVLMNTPANSLAAVQLVKRFEHFTAVDHVTLATPDRSEAVPVNLSDVRVVAKDVVDG